MFHIFKILNSICWKLESFEIEYKKRVYWNSKCNSMFVILSNRELPIVRFSQSVMQIVWSWKNRQLADYWSRYWLLNFFWIVFSILMPYLSFKKFNPLGAGNLGIRIKSLRLRLKLIFTWFCQKMISLSYYTRHLDKKKVWKCFIDWIFKFCIWSI